MPSPAQTAQLLVRDNQLVQIVDRSFAQAAERSAAHLLCRPGCTQCCHGAFAINSLDALRLRAGFALLRAEQPVLAGAVEARARRFLTEFGNDFPGDLQTGILGQSAEAQMAFEEFANEAPCPALNPATGLCDLYAARPMTCRVFGPPVRSDEGLAVCELCFTTASPEEIAACEMPLPHAEEEQLLAALSDPEEPRGETLVAFCLLPAGEITAF